MNNLADLFQWERFITPSIIKLFYILAVTVVVIFGLSGIFSGLGLMLVSPGIGFITVVASLIGVLAGVLLARISAEVILIVFRINEHLGAIRERSET